MMNLTEKYGKACERVRKLELWNKQLTEAKEKADKALDENEINLRAAMRERDELSAALSIAPEKKPSKAENQEENRKKRRAVFAVLQGLPNVWIAPQGVALISEIASDEVCALLRKATDTDGIPVEHNGKRGLASKYRWVVK